MEAIILEPKNKDELKAVRKAINEIGVRSFSISDSDKKYFSKLNKMNSADKANYIDEEFESRTKKERIQLARYKLSTLSKRNPKATASMQLINEVLQDIRKPANAKKKSKNHS
jgi:3-dehydroquinate dehydratase